MDIPEYSGVFPIGPDGTLIYHDTLIIVEGLTIEELRKLLKQSSVNTFAIHKCS